MSSSSKIPLSKHGSDDDTGVDDDTGSSSDSGVDVVVLVLSPHTSDDDELDPDKVFADDSTDVSSESEESTCSDYPNCEYGDRHPGKEHSYSPRRDYPDLGWMNAAPSSNEAVSKPMVVPVPDEKLKEDGGSNGVSGHSKSPNLQNQAK